MQATFQSPQPVTEKLLDVLYQLPGARVLHDGQAVTIIGPRDTVKAAGIIINDQPTECSDALPPKLEYAEQLEDGPDDDSDTDEPETTEPESDDSGA